MLTLKTVVDAGASIIALFAPMAHRQDFDYVATCYGGCYGVDHDQTGAPTRERLRAVPDCGSRLTRKSV